MSNLPRFDEAMIDQLAILDDPAATHTFDHEDTALKLKPKLDQAVKEFGQVLRKQPSPDWSQLAERLAGEVEPPDFSMCEEQLGEYLIGDLIGRGGMGEVYQVTHRRLDRVCAMKVIRRRLSLTAELSERFKREGKANGRLNHPHIARTTDAGEDKGYHYLVMDLIEGENLAKQVQTSGPLNGAEALKLIRQAASGLGYAHGKGVVHRDIKPGNLLLDEEGRVQIVDFGLAKYQEVDDLTQQGSFLGTADYTAPEPASSVDHRADIYSLGCTLYYLMTGKPVFPGEDFLAKRSHHRDTPAPDLAGKDSDVNRLFQQMVAKNPDDRFQSMQEVIDTIDAMEETDTAVVVKKRMSTGGDKTPAPTGGRGRMSRGWFIAGVLLPLGAALLAYAITMQFQSQHGTITVKANADDFDTAIQGKQIVLKHKKTGKTTKIQLNKIQKNQQLNFGEYELIVDPRSGLRSPSKSITVTRGETPVLEIVWQPPADRAKAGNGPVHRRVARWITQEGGIADLLVDGASDTTEVRKGDELPTGNFVIKQLNLSQEHRNGVKLSAAEIRDLRLLDGLESILGSYLPGEDAEEIARMLASHRSLKRIIWWQLPASDAAMVKIAQANPSLRYLNVAGDYCTDKTLAAISNLKHLESLHLGSPNFTAAGLKALTNIETLSELNLYRSSLSDDDIAVLVELPGLKQLVLSRNPVTDAAIDHLVKMPRLESLRIEDTQISAAGYQRLKAALPSCEITWKKEGGQK